MNCLEFRRQALTEPDNLGPQAHAHRESCATCRQFYEQIRHLDRNLAEAFDIDVPEGMAARVLLNRSLDNRKRWPARFRWMGVAASLLGALGLLLLMNFWKTPALEKAVLAHMESEAEVVRRAAGPVDESMVQKVLHQIQADSRSPLKQVVFAENCIIDGKLIAHFVVEEAGSQYTVILVPWNDLDDSIPVNNKHWRGMITPHEMGSLAVIGDVTTSDPTGVQRIINIYGKSITNQGA